MSMTIERSKLQRDFFVLSRRFIEYNPKKMARHKPRERNTPTTMTKEDLLKTRLNDLYNTFDKGFLDSDPLLFPHRFRSAKDKEIVALIASVLAYGRVTHIKKSVEKVLAIMGKSPYAFTMGFTPKTDIKLFKNLKHRFNDGRDVACLIYFMRQMIEQTGSIGDFFKVGYNKDDATIKEGLTSFTERALKLSHGNIYGRAKGLSLPLPKTAGVRYFFPSPKGGSACKRLNLYLRWMVRTGDELDLGLWKYVNPTKLIMPIDTHVARLSRHLGLTKRKTADWRMAEEVTEALRAFDGKDPVKYDFAISRLGILDECPSRPNKEKCFECLINDVCVIR